MRNNIKKFISFILVATMLFTFVSCGKKQSNDKQNDGDNHPVITGSSIDKKDDKVTPFELEPSQNLLVNDDEDQKDIAMQAAAYCIASNLVFEDNEIDSVNLFGIYDMGCGRNGLNEGYILAKLDYNMICSDILSDVTTSWYAITDGIYKDLDEFAKYICIYYNEAEYYYLGFLTETEINEKYSSKEMIDQYGNKYVAACCNFDAYDETAIKYRLFPSSQLNEAINPLDASALAKLGSGIYVANPDSLQKAYQIVDYFLQGREQIDSFEYVGMSIIYEGGYAVYKANSDYYAITYNPYENDLYDVTYVCGEEEFTDTNEFVVKSVFNLADIECAVRIEPYGFYYGPFNSPDVFGFNASDVAKMTELDIEANAEGDYWFNYDYKGLSFTCYHNEAETRDYIYSLETTRSDVFTNRNIRIGDSKEIAIQAYPEASNMKHPVAEYEGDYIWYSKNQSGLGASLLIWFENDVVSKFEVLFVGN